MRLRNIRIRGWRRLINEYWSEELKDIYRVSGIKGILQYHASVPPRSPYEKWIYVNENQEWRRRDGKASCSFGILLFYTGKTCAGVTSDSIRRQWHRRYHIYPIAIGGGREGSEIPWPDIREDYLVFLQEGRDVLAPWALRELAEEIGRENCDFLYSDQDEVDLGIGERKNPFFKPDWSPDTFASFFYTGNLAAYRNGVFPIGAVDFTDVQTYLYDYTGRFVDKAEKIVHVPKVLCHITEPYAYIVREEREKRELGKGLVSVIIPSKDNPEILERCLRSLAMYSQEEIREVIVVDNGSTGENKARMQALRERYPFRYLYQPMEFNFSRMCNLGAEQAGGSMLLFLNDDVEAFEPGWLTAMARLAERRHVGAVGAKLYYPGGMKIQHAGVINYDIGPGHCLVEQEDEGDLYYGRNRFSYNCLAVTGACMLLRRDAFENVGGFDEHLPVGYNDVELCFALYGQGYYNVLCNQARLYHHESLSRGYDTKNEEKARRLKQELEYLYKKYPDFRGRDPFYNVNLTGCIPDFDIRLDHYGERQADREGQADSKVQKFRWDIRAEWVNPKLKLNIDKVEETAAKISIEGWAYLEDEENTNYIRRILLKNNQGECFRVGTRSCYKGYLKERFPQVKGMEMLAFTCDFSRNDIKWGEGEYQIGMAAENKENGGMYLIFTDRTISPGQMRGETDREAIDGC